MGPYFFLVDFLSCDLSIHFSSEYDLWLILTQLPEWCGLGAELRLTKSITIIITLTSYFQKLDAV